MPAYLSEEWISEAARLLEAGSASAPDGPSLLIEQTVHGTPHGVVVYHLETAAGRLTLRTGPAPGAQVRLDTDWDTAVGVLSGSESAARAVLDGRLRLGGSDVALLREAARTIAVVQDVLAPLTARTSVA